MGCTVVTLNFQTDGHGYKPVIMDHLGFDIYACSNPEGGSIHPTPALKNHKKVGFLSNNGLDLLKITKLPSQHFMLGHHRPASETPPFRWRFAGRWGDCLLIIVVFGSPPNKKCQIWTPSGKTFTTCV